jgi:hypothetical protein
MMMIGDRVMPKHQRLASSPDRGDGFEDIHKMAYR